MMEQAETLDQSGRVLGPRALKTRARLLAATELQLGRQSVRELSVVEITREAGTSPATFYQYFGDVTDAVLLLAEHVSATTAAALAEVGDEWTGEEGLENARTMVNALLDIWDEHRSLLLARNVMADEGDERFHGVRRDSVGAMIGRLATRLREIRRTGVLAPEIHTGVAAIALVAMVERIAAYSFELSQNGMSRETLAETCARIVHDGMART
jgi:AcrR family transcriptional regulator